MRALFNHMKEFTMTRYRNTAIGVTATLVLALAATAAIAHSARMGGDMPGMAGGMGGMHQHGGPGAQLMDPQERQALREKMQGAKSPEERQALAASMRAEMEKRAKDKGIAMPEHRGPGRMGGHQH
jgi:Spy/CpxP family protein refolding chaperone